MPDFPELCCTLASWLATPGSLHLPGHALLKAAPQPAALHAAAQPLVLPALQEAEAALAVEEAERRAKQEKEAAARAAAEAVVDMLLQRGYKVRAAGSRGCGAAGQGSLCRIIL